MNVGIAVDCFYYELGHSDFVHSFFSTISFHLEQEGWATKYPLLMNDLYNAKLQWKDISFAKANLKEIEQELSILLPDQVVWNLDDLLQNPPWGDTISSQVTSLAHYFATADGKTFFEVLRAAMEVAEEEKCDLQLIQI